MDILEAQKHHRDEAIELLRNCRNQTHLREALYTAIKGLGSISPSYEPTDAPKQTKGILKKIKATLKPQPNAHDWASLPEDKR